MLAHGKVWIVFGLLLGAVPAVAAPEVRADSTDESECPPAIRGVELKVSNAKGAVVLDFIAPRSENVAGLRLLIGEAGAYVEFLTKMAALHSEELTAYDGNPLPAIDVTVKNLPTGARVTVRADQAHDFDAVMAQARTFKKTWDKNPCIAGLPEAAMPVGRFAPDRQTLRQ